MYTRRHIYVCILQGRIQTFLKGVTRLRFSDSKYLLYEAAKRARPFRPIYEESDRSFKKIFSECILAKLKHWGGGGGSNHIEEAKCTIQYYFKSFSNFTYNNYNKCVL